MLDSNVESPLGLLHMVESPLGLLHMVESPLGLFL